MDLRVDKQHRTSHSDLPEQMPLADAVLPWDEPFDRLSPDRWHAAQLNGIHVANGRLELELPHDAT